MLIGPDLLSFDIYYYVKQFKFGNSWGVFEIFTKFCLSKILFYENFPTYFRKHEIDGKKLVKTLFLMFLIDQNSIAKLILCKWLPTSTHFLFSDTTEQGQVNTQTLNP